MANDVKSANTSKSANECADLGISDGKAFIAQASPLTRLHYFDGQYLRADALAMEQDYLRERDRLANLAGGWGVVHGLGIAQADGALRVGAGLAITPAGNLVLAVGELDVRLADLLKLAAPAPVEGNCEFGDCQEGPPTHTAAPALQAYELTVAPAQTLCGNEAVYGKLCATACAGDSQRPWWREGVALRLRPIGLKLPDSSSVSLGPQHLRNRAASAYFAAEPWLAAPALGSAGLAGSLWCNPAALYGRDEVPIGLLILEGGAVRVLDAWSTRRERMDSQARGYWQGRMAMRPWNVFLAQILQFQCQLSQRFDVADKVLVPADECGQLRRLLDRARMEMEALHRQYSEGARTLIKKLDARPTKQEAQNLSDEVKAAYAQLHEIANTLSAAELGKGALPRNRMLIEAGFVELPPAGYLPVTPGKQDLEEQLSRMFGEGVRLAYQAVREDEIAHLLEEAQHQGRISLTRGLDDASRIEDVEIFVPDGKAVGVEAAAPGIWWQIGISSDLLDAIDLDFLGKGEDSEEAPGNLEKGLRKIEAAADSAGKGLDVATPKARGQLDMHGLARTEARADGSYGITLVCMRDAQAQAEKEEEDARLPIERDAAGEKPRALPRRQVAGANTAAYLAVDLDADPFGLDLGAQAGLKGEVRLGKQTADLDGRFTALFDRPLGGGKTERVLQFKLRLTKADDSTTQTSGRISLLRDSGANGGELVVDDAAHDPRTSPLFLDWTETPRRAVLSVLERLPGLYRRYMAAAGVAAKPGFASADGGAGAAEGADTADASRREVLDMTGLAAMPAIASPLGAAAMNALTGLAESMDDAAFLARASRRLFPALDAPAATRVRAVLDWVMFRRARTRLCCAAPAAPVEAGLEAFQVWHLSVADRKELKALQDALDGNDAQRLAGYGFRRVGVLRYREQNVVSEEPDRQVLAMWRQARPGAKVLLGRYWEQTPSTGQGWQNRFRLNNMLAQIASLTQPPTAGGGAIAPLAAVSPPLSGGGLDGGMLVVTMAAATTYLHRVLMADTEIYRMLAARIEKAPAQAWEALQGVLEKQGFRQDLTVRFQGATPAATDIANLVSADTAMRGDEGEYRLSALSIASNTLLPGEDPPAQHETLSRQLRVHEQGGAFTTGDDDLGNGAHAVSVIGYARGETPVRSYDHLVAFIDEENFNRLYESAKDKGGDDALGQLDLDLAGPNPRYRSAVVTFDDGVLRETSIAEIKALDDTWKHFNDKYTIKAMHLDATQARADEDLEAQFKSVAAVVNVSSGNLLGGFTAPAFDTRDTFRAVTLLGYFLQR